MTCLVELFRNLAIDFKLGEDEELDPAQIYKDLMAIVDELEDLPDINAMQGDISSLEESSYEIENGFQALDSLEGTVQNLEEQTSDLLEEIEKLESEVQKIIKPVPVNG